jgi:hypothetical protein
MKKLGWFIMFLIVGALSCWATASSFLLIIPLPWYVIWAMTIVFFVFASYAYKMIMDAIHNDGSIENPKAKLWGGIFLLLMTWGIISMPTNAHTFFYKLQVGNVVTEDLKITGFYSEQLAKRENISKVDSAEYKIFKRECDALLNTFTKEANGSGSTGMIGINTQSLHHISDINTKLGQYGKYNIEEPNRTNYPPAIKQEISNTKNRLDAQYAKIEDEQLRVSRTDSYQAQEDLNKIQIMQAHINDLIAAGRISHASSEPFIKQANGVLTLAYSNIKPNAEYVYFTTKDDEKLYTAANIETRTSRFLHPYKVFGDFFVGRIPFIFIFWIILSILLDVIGFISFDNAFKKEDF